jgi:hypothetical protein
MAGCTVQTGRNWPTCFGLAQPLRLVAHLSVDRGGRSANDGAGGGPVGSATRRTHLGSWDREVLTGRMSSMAMCGRPEENDGGGGV